MNNVEEGSAYAINHNNIAIGFESLHANDCDGSFASVLIYDGNNNSFHNMGFFNCAELICDPPPDLTWGYDINYDNDFVGVTTLGLTYPVYHWNFSECIESIYDIGGPPGEGSANGINDHRQIVGIVANVAFFFEDNKFDIVGHIGLFDFFNLLDIANTGQAVGFRRIRTSRVEVPWLFEWSERHTEQNTNLPVLATGKRATAVKISNNGEYIVGTAADRDNIIRAVRWRRTAPLWEIEDLNVQFGEASFATCVNDDGNVVGYYYNAKSKPRPFIYWNGDQRSYRIRRLVSNENIALEKATGINNNNWIVGNGKNRESKILNAWIIHPVTP